MKIGKPVDSVPPDSRVKNGGKYADIYRALGRLRGKKWLPIAFENTKEAYNFRVAAHTHRTLSLRAKMRGNVVYVQKGEPK